mgnify:CR=1 FL=1
MAPRVLHAQGYFWDLAGTQPPAAEPLTATAGWRHAAALLAALLEFNAPSEGTGPILAYGDLIGTAAARCPPVSPLFTNGSCLFTVEFDAVFTSLSKYAALTAPGVLRVAPLPGSRTAMLQASPVAAAAVAVAANGSGSGNSTTNSSSSRSSSSSAGGGGSSSANSIGSGGSSGSSSSLGGAGTLVQCTAQTCPLGLPHDLRYLSSSSASGPINRAPYSALLDMRAEVNNAQTGASVMDLWSLLFAIGVNVSFSYRDTRQEVTNSARAALGYSRRPDGRWDADVYARTEWWRAAPTDFNATAYIVMGHSRQAANSYTRALWHAIHHPNLAMDVPSPLMLNWYRHALEWGGWQLRPGANVTVAAAVGNLSATNSSGSGSSSSSSSSSSSGGGGNGTAAEGRRLRLLQQQQADNATASSDEETPQQRRERLAALVTGEVTRFFRLSAAVHGTELVRTVYATHIGGAYAPPKVLDKTTATATDGGGDGNKTKLLVTAIVVPVAGTALLLGVVVAAVVVYMRRHNRDMLGRVRAPRAGPDTTLLVSDVQVRGRQMGGGRGLQTPAQTKPNQAKLAEHWQRRHGGGGRFL